MALTHQHGGGNLVQERGEEDLIRGHGKDLVMVCLPAAVVSVPVVVDCAVIAVAPTVMNYAHTKEWSCPSPPCPATPSASAR